MPEIVDTIELLAHRLAGSLFGERADADARKLIFASLLNVAEQQRALCAAAALSAFHNARDVHKAVQEAELPPHPPASAATSRSYSEARGKDAKWHKLNAD